tara:strand:+ start:478 stop:1566 length:1089 start_codon:yes stop_codon:yes gene_type:complete
MTGFYFIFLPFGSLIHFILTGGQKYNKQSFCERFSKIDIFGPLALIATVVWSLVVSNNDIKMPWTEKHQSVIFSILTGTLTFLLPLVLSSALDRNKTIIKEYNCYNDNVLQLAWEVTCIGGAYESECDSAGSDDWNRRKADIFSIIKILPNMIKHNFRGDFNYAMLKNKKLTNNVRNNIIPKMEKKDPKGENPINQLFFELMIMITDACYTAKDQKHSHTKLKILMGVWERTYDAAGYLVSFVTWDEPLLFQFFLYTGFILYIIILPFEFVNGNDWNIVVSFIIIYFYVSLNSARVIMLNPFAPMGEGNNIFLSSSEITRNYTNAVQEVEDYINSPDCGTTMNIIRNRFVPMKKFAKSLKYV